MTVCFGGHDVTVTAADARPVAPVGFGECVDLNLGQRLDVTVKPNGTAKSDWLSGARRPRVGPWRGVGPPWAWAGRGAKVLGLWPGV
jgi:FtsP/CotA-like multicopper oxidase with cupredoxin domain